MDHHDDIYFRPPIRSPNGTKPAAEQIAQTQEMSRRQAEMLGLTLADISPMKDVRAAHPQFQNHYV